MCFVWGGVKTGGVVVVEHFLLDLELFGRRDESL